MSKKIKEVSTYLKVTASEKLEKEIAEELKNKEEKSIASLTKLNEGSREHNRGRGNQDSTSDS